MVRDDQEKETLQTALAAACALLGKKCEDGICCQAVTANGKACKRKATYELDLTKGVKVLGIEVCPKIGCCFLLYPTLEDDCRYWYSQTNRKGPKGVCYQEFGLRSILFFVSGRRPFTRLGVIYKHGLSQLFHTFYHVLGTGR